MNQAPELTAEERDAVQAMFMANPQDKDEPKLIRVRPHTFGGGGKPPPPWLRSKRQNVGQRDKALQRRRAKNKVARASRKANRR